MVYETEENENRAENGSENGMVYETEEHENGPENGRGEQDNGMEYETEEHENSREWKRKAREWNGV